MLRHHPSASVRRQEAVRWVQQLPQGAEGIVLAPTLSAANALLRDAMRGREAAFGWHRLTLGQLAAQLGLPQLAAQGRTPASPLAMEALAARVVFELAQAGRLGRFTPVAHRPGLPRALVRTLRDLELAEVSLDTLPDQAADLRVVGHALRAACASYGVSTRAELLSAACARAAERAHPLLGLPVLALDLPVRSPLEARLLATLLGAHVDSCALVPTGDVATRAACVRAGLPEADALESQGPPIALTRLVHDLFAPEDRERAPARDTEPTAASQAASTPADNAERTSSSPAGPESAPVATSAAQRPDPPAEDRSVRLLSAPGESRECIELARLALEYAREGVPFERMAVLLRSPEAYQAHLREALRRAGIPLHVTHGARRPEPGGRALLALLDCVAEGLSARALGEYLSLGVLPRSEDGAPPAAASPSAAFVPPDEAFLPSALVRLRGDERGESGPEDGDDDFDEGADDEPHWPEVRASGAPVPSGEGGATRASNGDLRPDAESSGEAGAGVMWSGDGSIAGESSGGRRLRAPRTWEALLIECRAVSGRERWTTRLTGLRAELELRLAEVLSESPDAPRARGLSHKLASLDALCAFVLPLLDELDALPSSASWGTWVTALTRLATRALREPLPVLRALAELEPMGDVGPVSLTEVRLVLGERLGELRDPPSTQLAGKLFVGTPDEARGMAFDVVFVPGLAEKLFPKKVLEDPILLDAVRTELSSALPTLTDRVADERLALHLAVGAAERAVVLSWPRVDTERGRPRVPSFYGLEVVRAAEGSLPDFHALEARASHGAASRLGWPAPEQPSDAIDDAEYDLATLARALTQPADAQGAARYLLDANPHLGRALRARARRHGVRRFVSEDGLVQPSERAAAALAKHRLAARAYSATALERYARCPYQFYLHSIARLSPREVPERVEGLDPLTRGSFIHEVQFRVLRALRDRELLPITRASLPQARAEVERCFAEVEREYRERLAPAIEDVFRAHVEVIHLDLLEWVARLAEPEAGGAFVQTHFELAFGLPRSGDLDTASRTEPLALSAGLLLRGSIDLVERRGRTLRATDYKTGRNTSAPRLRIGGGQTLQPALYAMALEALFPEDEVSGGRLYFCTTRGDFTANEVPLDDTTRAAVRAVLDAVDGALADGFLPPVPDETGGHSACDRCDYLSVCGHGEGRRVAAKVSRAESKARGSGDEAVHGQRLIQLRVLRGRE
ncbi:MAG: PD-(D/E)XK nuclease family protein [Sandaracinaceae bacterium]|nr:PD-(D/E)XK nuclease family protein [Sandaracinaceae bacterium]